MRVYIIGAGPGDPGLLTVRGLELIRRCPVIVFTGSLVPREILAEAREGAKILDSASMDLDGIMDVLLEAKKNDHDVARVHTGDPMIYGSTAEQMRRMHKLDIPYQIVPGVSSFTAAAAALGKELTLPEVSQTVIISRAEGRTPMPDGEKLPDLGKHGATLALFLSITLLAKVSRELTPQYGADCPVAVVHKATLPEQKIVLGTLETIQAKVKAEGITSQSIVLIGRVLDCEDFADSRLYASDFSHGYRRADGSPARLGETSVAAQKAKAQESDKS